MDVPTNKNRKLNSKNPKYQNKVKDDVKIHRKLIKEVKGVKVYGLFIQ